MGSLRARLLCAALGVLALFILLCGAALERAFERSALQAQQDRLQGLVYALLAITEPTAAGSITLSNGRLPDTRLENPGSGLGAALLDERGQTVWVSPSWDESWTQASPPEVGESRFQRLEPGFSLSFGLRWFDGEDVQRYTLHVMEGGAQYREQMQLYRRTLWTGLGLAATTLLLALVAVLAWGLRPLGLLSRELRAVESGGQRRIEGRYPRELQALTAAINAMIQTGYAQLERQRNALADLAHSLKTPLAVLRNAGDAAGLSDELRDTLREQVGRMQHIADHQLRRAATAGSRALGEPVALRALAQKIIRALEKVYATQAPQFELAIEDSLRVRADAGDLYELLGNLLDNAVKHGGRQIRVQARQAEMLELIVEDNGPGFAEPRAALLERGVRADSHTPGQGIGLAAVAELVRAYEGRIELERSERLGGARVRISL